jgi:NhaA family Na+:H+ antiporter
MAMHPWVTNVVMPIFALTNAGVSLRGTDLSTGGGLVMVGTAVALVAGKPLGFVGASSRCGWAGAPCSGRFV